MRADVKWKFRVGSQPMANGMIDPLKVDLVSVFKEQEQQNI
jgi:hypothetical protein